MKLIRQLVCLLLGISMALTLLPIPARAEETEASTEMTETLEEPTVSETEEVTEDPETVPETTEPETEETEPEETEPEETEPEETESEETEPEETESEETEPEETEDSSIYSQSDSMSYNSTDDQNGTDGQVPLYLQTDYPRVPYSGGSVANSGCTITCVAMVASYLRQEEILPDDLAWRFGDYEASNIQRMEAASIVLDLEYETTLYWWDVVEALKEGKVAIVLLEADSPFTSSQHTVVLWGITADGRILVHDPNGDNYEKDELRKGFVRGFPQEFVQQGFSGGWIYEDYTPPVVGECRYPAIEMTPEEKDMLAGIIWLEARGESFEGQQAIAEVVFNRIASDGFSDTVRGTLLAEGQFRTAKFLDDAKPGELQHKAIEKALSGPYVLPKNVYFFGRKAANDRVWGQIGGHVFCFGKE